MHLCGERGEGEGGGQSSYSLGNTPLKINMAGNRRCGTFWELAKDMEPKKYWNYFDVTQWFDFWYKHNQFYKGDPHQPQDSSF